MLSPPDFNSHRYTHTHATHPMKRIDSLCMVLCMIACTCMAYMCVGVCVCVRVSRGISCAYCTMSVKSIVPGNVWYVCILHVRNQLGRTLTMTDRRGYTHDYASCCLCWSKLLSTMAAGYCGIATKLAGNRSVDARTRSFACGVFLTLYCILRVITG